MLEIIVVIAVVKAFASLAQSKNRNKFVWGTIGALSYYIPVLTMGLVLFPILVQAGLLPFVTQNNAVLVNIGLNLVAGILCCTLAYVLLKSLPDAHDYMGADYDNYGRTRNVDPDNPYSP